MIGPINLDMKQTGKRSAGNRPAAFDVAGAGNVTMVAGLRAIAKAVESPPTPTGAHASSRPYLREAGGETPPAYSPLCIELAGLRLCRVHHRRVRPTHCRLACVKFGAHGLRSGRTGAGLVRVALPGLGGRSWAARAGWVRQVRGAVGRPASHAGKCVRRGESVRYA